MNLKFIENALIHNYSDLYKNHIQFNMNNQLGGSFRGKRGPVRAVHGVEAPAQAPPAWIEQARQASQQEVLARQASRQGVRDRLRARHDRQQSVQDRLNFLDRLQRARRHHRADPDFEEFPDSDSAGTVSTEARLSDVSDDVSDDDDYVYDLREHISSVTKRRNARKICVICFDQIENPIILSACEHTLCGKCTYEWIDICEQEGNSMNCPICRTELTGDDLEMLVDKFAPDVEDGGSGGGGGGGGGGGDDDEVVAVAAVAPVAPPREIQRSLTGLWECDCSCHTRPHTNRHINWRQRIGPGCSRRRCCRLQLQWRAPEGWEPDT